MGTEEVGERQGPRGMRVLLRAPFSNYFIFCFQLVACPNILHENILEQNSDFICSIFGREVYRETFRRKLIPGDPVPSSLHRHIVFQVAPRQSLFRIPHPTPASQADPVVSKHGIFAFSLPVCVCEGGRGGSQTSEGWRCAWHRQSHGFNPQHSTNKT